MFGPPRTVWLGRLQEVYASQKWDREDDPPGTSWLYNNYWTREDVPWGSSPRCHFGPLTLTLKTEREAGEEVENFLSEKWSEVRSYASWVGVGYLYRWLGGRFEASTWVDLVSVRVLGQFSTFGPDETAVFGRSLLRVGESSWKKLSEMHNSIINHFN